MFYLFVYICTTKSVTRDNAVLCVQLWKDYAGEKELSEGFVWRGGLKMIFSMHTVYDVINV